MGIFDDFGSIFRFNLSRVINDFFFLNNTTYSPNSDTMFIY